MNLDTSKSYSNPLYNSRVFDHMDWTPMLDANIRKSCKILGSYDILKKIKARSSSKRHRDFFNISFVNHLFNLYKELGFKFDSPVEIRSNEDYLIMSRVQGLDLKRILEASNSLGENNLRNIMNKLGGLIRLKENEGLYHSDFQLRHVMVGNNIGLIDLEGSQFGNFSQSNEENLEFILDLENSLTEINNKRSSTTCIDYLDLALGSIQEGYRSFPVTSLKEKALDLVYKKYSYEGLDSYLYLQGRLIEQDLIGQKLGFRTPRNVINKKQKK